MTGAFIPEPKFTAWDSNGDPLVGGLVYTYECGGTTPKTTYSDRALSVANTNPVVLDARGESDIYQSGCLKIVLKTSAGVTVYTVDNFAGVGESFLQDADGDTIVNVEESADEDIIRFDCGGTEQIIVQNGAILPTTDDDIDLGSAALQFKNLYIDGTANIDTLVADTATVAGVAVDDLIKFDGTAGRVLRMSYLQIANATDANEIKCTLIDEDNGDAIAVTDNIGKGETVGNFTLDANGQYLRIEAAGLTGNCVGVLSGIIVYNASGTAANSYVSSSGGDIEIVVRNATTAASIDLTVAVDTGQISIVICYLTSA